MSNEAWIPVSELREAVWDELLTKEEAKIVLWSQISALQPAATPITKPEA